MDPIGPFLLFDQILPAGVLSPVVVSAPYKTARISGSATLESVLLSTSHSGLGAAAAAVVQTSVDGINWNDAAAASSLGTLTGATPVTVLVSIASWGWIRILFSHGGAAGGRVVVMAREAR
jgi:hypothetical protein